MLELLRSLWSKAKDAVTYLRNAIFGKPYAPKKYSPEFVAALKEPIVRYGTDAYALNTGLDLAKWEVKLTDAPIPNPDNQPKLFVEITTARLKFRQIGLGTPEQKKADLDFYASMYADPKVTVTYATGKSYTYAEAFWAAVGRFNMFASRTNDGKAFTGFIAELRDTNERVGVLNVGHDDLNKDAVTIGDTPAPLALDGKTTVVPAVMLASKFHGQGFGTEASVAGLLYLSQVKAKDYKTLALVDASTPSLGNADFNAVAFTYRPNNPMAVRLGAEVVGTSNVYGATPDKVRNVGFIPAQKLVDIANNTVARDTAANRPTIKI